MSEFEINGYKLAWEPKGASWYAKWYDPATRRTRRKSLGEPDLEKAKVKLAAFVLKHQRPNNAAPSEVRLIQVLVPYLEEVTDKKPSATQARISARLIRDFFDTSFISDLTPQRQREFIRWCAEKGHSPAYISRTMSVLSAALGWARKEGELFAVPQIILSRREIGEIADAAYESPDYRRLTVEELAAFIDAIERRSDYLFRYVLLALNTTARPDAITDLGPRQVDFHGRLIRLNPPGRRQTKKFRPTVPMTETIAPWLRAWDVKEGRYVHYAGKPVANLKRAVRLTAIRAGLLDKDEWTPERNVTPYTFRRTMGRLLRFKGVPMAEIAGIMGHKVRGFSVTEGYADVDPEYLQRARQAIDEIMAELHAKASRAVIFDQNSTESGFDRRAEDAIRDAET